MPRPSIPRSIRDQVLMEFRQRCALCGADRPHVHHIDENPSNNQPENLLPLCPNCHLTDQHNPTSAIPQTKLSLFRKYKDPTILKPQFHPIFMRLIFLDKIEESEDDITDLVDSATELVEFIEELEHGKFYAKQLTNLLGRATPISFWSVEGPNPESERAERSTNLEHRQKVLRNRERAKELVVELLRYQKWAKDA